MCACSPFHWRHGCVEREDYLWSLLVIGGPRFVHDAAMDGQLCCACVFSVSCVAAEGASRRSLTVSLPMYSTSLLPYLSNSIRYRNQVL